MRKDQFLSNVGLTLDMKEYLSDVGGEITESVFVPNGVIHDLDDVIETAASATGISLEEAEIYEEELCSTTLAGDILPPANGDFYDDKKDKLIPTELNAYKYFKELQNNKLHHLKKQLTLNYFRPIEKENFTIDSLTDISEEELVRTPELIVQIAVYKENRLLKSRGLLMYASQTLAEFADAIDCTMDLAVCWEEMSNNPFLKNVDWSTKTRDSCALYIGDTIYIDKRSPNHVDYSKEIIAFLQMHSETLSRGQEVIEKVGDLAKTRFIDLKFNLGLPYVFIHQGSCEHLIIVEQVRLFHPGDDPRQVSYPRQIFRGGPRRTSCTICSERLARWITYNDEEAPSSPSYFCFECFWCMHYSDKGEKLHEFNAYVYMEYMEDRVGYQIAYERCKSSIIKSDIKLKAVKTEGGDV